jgi:hypothetical protein
MLLSGLLDAVEAALEAAVVTAGALNRTSHWFGQIVLHMYRGGVYCRNCTLRPKSAATPPQAYSIRVQVPPNIVGETECSKKGRGWGV